MLGFAKLLDDWLEMKDICQEPSLSVFFPLQEFWHINKVHVLSVSALPYIFQGSLIIMIQLRLLLTMLGFAKWDFWMTIILGLLGTKSECILPCLRVLTYQQSICLPHGLLLTMLGFKRWDFWMTGRSWMISVKNYNWVYSYLSKSFYISKSYMFVVYLLCHVYFKVHL